MSSTFTNSVSFFNLKNIFNSIKGGKWQYYSQYLWTFVGQISKVLCFLSTRGSQSSIKRQQLNRMMDADISVNYVCILFHLTINNIIFMFWTRFKVGIYLKKTRWCRFRVSRDFPAHFVSYGETRCFGVICLWKVFDVCDNLIKQLILTVTQET